VWSTAAALAMMSLATAGAYNYRVPIRETASTVMARAFSTGASAQVAYRSVRNVTPSAAPAAAATQLTSMNATIELDRTSTSSTIANGTLLAAVSDSIEWIPAVARTWVNVRDDAGRGGNVVGVINPSSRAMLGTTRAGWRQVKSTDVTGWVDPRLFEPDSLRTRGL